MDEVNFHIDDICMYVDNLMERNWKDYRYELYQYFKGFKSTEEARQYPYGHVTQEDWSWLCTFFENKYSERRPKKDHASRVQLPYKHRAWLKSSLCHNDDDDDDEEELFYDTHLPAASNPPTEELHADTEELRKEMDELRAMVNNQWAGADMINSILQDQQERLRRLEERVFNEKDNVALDQEAKVWNQEERLRRLEERIFAGHENENNVSDPGFSSNMPGLN
ncbi:hypothetical protein Patl1_17787 [Pistacia atlantica]|uniref:Uncharacterized protein n=1 Tax=Pistacia atlantica TaxID=434234 RepID=A0ACC1BYL0_9ROSI|nr:hypothetical protein Patl1_17787 [Pistacia atlantica]